MSHYAEYLRERTTDHIIETDTGFVTYRFTDSDTCYLIDIYVRPDFRMKREATDLANRVARIAQERGCKFLLGSVVPSTKGSTDSLRALLAYGMRLDSSTNDFIVFRKDI